MEHVPAWKRIAIKNQDASARKEDTALNVTTHLATANLSKKEKRKIIRGETDAVKPKKKANPNKRQKKDKLPREERNVQKEQVLKDQLRYLIDFYREKVGKLPSEVWEHKPVRAQLGEPKESDDDEEEEEESDKVAKVVEVWKFSKQKQNWLLKHILDDTQIPACYDELVYSYFKDLKGGSKLALMQSCREVIERNDKALATEAAKEEEKETKETAEGEVEAQEKQEEKVKNLDTMAPPSGHQVERAQKLLELLETASAEEA